ncbi:hypothetical protein PYCC9005_005187 [Savitreella phatthalungensis]
MLPLRPSLTPAAELEQQLRSEMIDNDADQKRSPPLIAGRIAGALKNQAHAWIAYNDRPDGTISLGSAGCSGSVHRPYTERVARRHLMRLDL